MAKDKKEKKGGAPVEEQKAPETPRHSAKETPRLKERFRKEVAPALLKELREHEKQAAQELGQWVEKKKVEQFTKAYITVGPDEL